MKKIITVLTLVFFFIPSVSFASSLTDSQVNAIINLLTSFGADSSTIANVRISLTGGTPETTSTTVPATPASYTFLKDLTVGASGADVTALQNILISTGYLSGSATGYFGSLTKTAVIKWQTAVGVSPASGYIGVKSRATLGGSTSTGTINITDSTSTNGAMTQAQLDAQNAALGRKQFNTAPAIAPPLVSSGLKVSLSPTSPNGRVLVQGQSIGNLGDFTFTNPTSAPINVTKLSFKRIGASSDSTMMNVYLYNSDSMRITDAVGVSNAAFSFSDLSRIFTVPAGGTYTVSVRSDIASGISDQQLGVQLVSVISNGTLDPSVYFPISSGYQTISAPLAIVNFSDLPTPRAGVALFVNPQNDSMVWQDTLIVSQNPVRFSSITFTNYGSINPRYLTNLRLYVNDVQVGSTVPVLGADSKVTFDFSIAPVTLSTQNHTIKVLADITGGSDTFQFSLRRSSDVIFVDSQQNKPVMPLFLGNSFSPVTTGVLTMNSVSPGSISISLSPTSPNQNIITGTSNVKWVSFDILSSSGEDVKFFPCYVNFSIASPSVATEYKKLQNPKIFANGSQICDNIHPPLILKSDQMVTVYIYADAKYYNGTGATNYTNLPDNSTVTVMLDARSWSGQGQSSLKSVDTPATVISGNTIMVVGGP